MKIFQILHGMCHWETPFKSLDETFGKFPTDCLFVEAPDYVTEQWGFDEFAVGDERFIKPSLPKGIELDEDEDPTKTPVVYNDETGTYVEEEVLAQALDEAKTKKQTENNEKLAEFLKNHPITYTDGKLYGVTKDDQNEITMNLVSYQNDKTLGIENPIIEWHAVGEPCVAWTYEELSKLAAAIRNFAYPWYSLNQSYKAAINDARTKAELDAITLTYETEEEKNARVKAEEEELKEITEPSEQPPEEATDNETAPTEA